MFRKLENKYYNDNKYLNMSMLNIHYLNLTFVIVLTDYNSTTVVEMIIVFLGANVVDIAA